MQFHDYQLTKRLDKEPYAKLLSLNDYYDYMAQYAANLVMQSSDEGRSRDAMIDIVLTESSYVACRRPFYNVYPSVVKCLENTRLDFRLDQIQPLNECVAICFAVGHEPSADWTNSRSCRRVDSILIELRDFNEISLESKVVRGIRIIFNTDSDDGTEYYGAVNFKADDRTIRQVIEESDSELLPGISLQKSTSLISIAIGVAMLAQDERFAEPILLKRDQGKQLDAEGLQRAIERAKRNGRNGMTIGRTLEISPHFRSPHFGIRWTGKGGTVPKLVPVKGCVVSRNKLYPIPTGYLDGESGDSEGNQT